MIFHPELGCFVGVGPEARGAIRHDPCAAVPRLTNSVVRSTINSRH